MGVYLRGRVCVYMGMSEFECDCVCSVNVNKYGFIAST